MGDSVYSCDPFDRITGPDKEPVALFWNGRACDELANIAQKTDCSKSSNRNCKIDDNDKLRKATAGPGVYNCGYDGCDNNTLNSVGDDAIDGIWIPPNMYAWLYNDYQRDLKSDPIRDVDFNNLSEPKEMIWKEGALTQEKELCPSGKYVNLIDEATFREVNNPNNSITVTDKWDIKRMLGLGKYKFAAEDMYKYLGDPAPGRGKEVYIKYHCGDSNIRIPSGEPSGVYGPGFFDSVERRGKYDNSKYILDNYGVPAENRAQGDSVDTVVIRRSRPWKEHLRDCCFNKQDMIKDEALCGRFGMTKKGISNPDWGKNCAYYLNECSPEDIKEGGKCYHICEANPKECDKIKLKYCQWRINDPWCRCINYEKTADYKDFIATYPEASGIPKVCMPNNGCRTKVDLRDIFLTDLDSQNAKNLPCDLILSKINIAGSDINANINVKQGSGATAETKPGTEPTQPTQPTTSGLSSTMMLMILFFFVVIVGVFFAVNTKGKINNIGNK